MHTRVDIWLIFLCTFVMIRRVVLYLCACAACLENDEKNSYLVLTRSLEVAAKRQQYQWATKNSSGDVVSEFQGFPGSTAAGSDVMALPHELRYVVSVCSNNVRTSQCVMAVTFCVQCFVILCQNAKSEGNGYGMVEARRSIDVM